MAYIFNALSLFYFIFLYWKEKQKNQRLENEINSLKIKLNSYKQAGDKF